MRFILIGVILITSLVTLSGQPQIEATKVITLEARPLGVYLDDVTQVPIVSTTSNFTGLDPKTLEPIWSVNRSNLAGFTQLANSEDNVAEDFEDLLDMPFVQLGPTIVDARTGASLFEEADGIRKIHYSQHLKDNKLLLVRTNTEGDIKLFGFDDESGERKFGVVLSDKVGLVGSKKNAAPPVFDQQGHLRYADDKSLSLIDVKAGKLLWKVDRKAAELFFSPDEKYVLVAEPAGGLLSLGMDKTVFAYDYQTGQSLWNGSKGLKLSDNFVFAQNLGTDELFMVNSDGMNVYDWKTGTQRWKKDFSENAIREIVVEGDLLQVTYKNRLIPVSLKDGKSTMKKGEKIPGLSWFMGTLVDESGKEVADKSATPVPTIQLAGKELRLLSDNKLRWGEEEITYNRLAIDVANGRLATAVVDLEKTNPKDGGYEYKINIYEEGTVYPVSIPFLRGIESIGFNKNGDLIAYNTHLMYHFVAKDGQLDLPTVIIMDYKKRGFETIGKLLGGGDDVVPEYFREEYGLYADIVSGNKKYADIGKLPMGKLPLVGRYGDGLQDSNLDDKKAKKFKIPLFLIFDADSGKLIHQEDAPGDNANFTIDEAHNRIYFMADNELRIYDF